MRQGKWREVGNDNVYVGLVPGWEGFENLGGLTSLSSLYLQSTLFYLGDSKP